MSLPYNKNNVHLARTLRKNMTKQEKHLWYDFLSGFTPNFQRQKMIDTYIADFYCHDAGLVIELDGSQHYDDKGLKQDAERTRILETYGLAVLRIWNHDIDTNFSAVCDMIAQTVKTSKRHRRCRTISHQRQV